MRSHEAASGGAVVAAEHGGPDAGPVGQGLRNGEGVGEDVDVARLTSRGGDRQLPRDDQDRASAVEEDGIAGVDQAQAGASDACLRVDVAAHPRGKVRLDRGTHRDRAAVGAEQQLLPGEIGDVLADRGFGDAEQPGELGVADAAAFIEHAEDAGVAFRGERWRRLRAARRGGRCARPCRGAH